MITSSYSKKIHNKKRPCVKGPLPKTFLLKYQKRSDIKIVVAEKENLNRGLHALYELSGRSAGHVNQAFRQYLNQTPTEYINQLRLNVARNLLLTTELRVVEIALESGFENAITKGSPSA